MWAPECSESPTRVGVLLDRGLDDLLGRLVQTRVDDLEPGVTQRAGDDLRPTVVPVEPGFRDDDAVLAGHARPSLAEGRCGPRGRRRCSRAIVAEQAALQPYRGRVEDGSVDAHDRHARSAEGVVS